MAEACELRAVGYTQASAVMALEKRRLGELETRMYWLEPSKLNASPTLPGLKVGEFTGIPLFVPRLSRKLLSPDHQLTMPEGGGSQGGAASTFKEALLLMTGLPGSAPFMMATE